MLQRFRSSWLRCLSLFFFLPFISKGQDSAIHTLDTVKSQMILPAAYYTPETKLAFGIAALKLFKMGEDSLKDSTFSSNIQLKGLYTLANQYDFEGFVNLYTQQNRYQINLVLNYRRYPFPFFGIGNVIPLDPEKYTSADFTWNSKIIRRLNKTWFLGWQQQFKNTEIIEIVPNGLLSGNISGNKGGITSGVGFVIRKDSRDNVNSAYKGSYWNFEWIGYDDLLFSDFNFWHALLDLRGYKSVRKRKHWVWATQFRVEINQGNVPFFKMAQLGGYRNMRGYFLGQYRDLQYWNLQLEARRIFNPFLSLVPFLNLGGVGDKWREWELNLVRASAGIGIRITPPKADRLGFRIDYAKAISGHAWYFTIGEAF